MTAFFCLMEYTYKHTDKSYSTGSYILVEQFACVYTMHIILLCTVYGCGGLDSIVVGSEPDLHDAHKYKPNV